MLHEKIVKLLIDHNVKLDDESVTLAFTDGTVSVYLEETAKGKEMKIDVEMIDRVIPIESSIEILF